MVWGREEGFLVEVGTESALGGGGIWQGEEQAGEV